MGRVRRGYVFKGEIKIRKGYYRCRMNDVCLDFIVVVEVVV